MNAITSHDPLTFTLPQDHPPPRLGWGAVIAGVFTTLAVQLVLMLLGAGLGLAVFHPVPAADGVTSLGAGAAMIHGISTVVSLWAGGWIAGRFPGPAGGKSGRLHGFLVWCAATVIAVMLLSSGTRGAPGGLGKVLAGQSALQGVAELTNEAADDSKSLFGSFTEEGTSLAPDGKTGAESIRAKRELSYAISRLFTGGITSMPANQQAVVRMLVDSQGMTEPEARRMMDGWVVSYQTMKADAAAAMQALEGKTREAAEKAARIIAVLSLCYFAAFVLGAVAATLGGAHGASGAMRQHEASPADNF